MSTSSGGARVLAFGLRVLVVTAVVLALAGLQWKKPQDGMNIYFLMDRSQSVPNARSNRRPIDC